MPPHGEAALLEPVGPDTSGRGAFLSPAAAAAWLSMREHAAGEGAPLLLVSAYRGIERQRGIVESKLAGGASLSEVLSVSAYPGHSEHHTGRAVDVGAPGLEDLVERFEGTPQFAWLTANAGRYGFFLTYPRGNRHGIAYEPWHWCFTPGPGAPQ